MADNDNGGWVRLHRSITEHKVWSCANARAVWIWAILQANWKPKFWKGQEIPRGSFVTGRMAGAEANGMTPSTFQRALDKLVEFGCVTLKADSQKTIVTVCNYDTYQDDKPIKRTADGQPMDSERTADGQPMDTTKKDKKGTRGRTEKEIQAAPPPGGSSSDGDADPKPKSFDPLAVEIPPAIRTPQFLAAWNSWAVHRREIKKPLTPKAVDEQLKLLAKRGASTAVEMLEASIANGWQGLFEPRKKPPQSEHINTNLMRPIYGDDE